MMIKRNSRGITLIALVITIIVVLILFGTYMFILRGENSLLTSAINAGEEYTKQGIREKLNIELINILSKRILKGYENSKELSLEEFENLNYDTQKEYENGFSKCYIIQDGYVFEIQEDEGGKQEVVFFAKEKTLNPKIIDVKLKIENSTLKIETIAKRADKYTYTINFNNELMKHTSTETSLEIDLKSLDDKYKNNDNINVFGTFSIGVTAINDNNKNKITDNQLYNKEKTIDVSKVTFDAYGGNFEDGEEKHVAFIKSGNKLNTINEVELTEPTQIHYNFDAWYIDNKKLIFDEATISEPEVIIQAGWNYIEHEYEVASVIKEPTCEEEGIQTEKCIICGEEKEVTLAHLGHDYLEYYTVDVEATCTEDGSESRHCTRCSSIIDERVIAKTNHQYGEYTTIKDATCGEEGSKERTCSVCGTVETTVIAKTTTHTPGAEANCAHAQTCTVCGVELSPKTTSHSYGTKKVSISSTQHAYKCTVCGATKDAGSHSWSGWKQYSSSNSNYKTKHYKQCSVCSTTSSADHSHSKYTYSMMSASQHFKKSTCACGYVISSNPEGHNTKNPCTAQGYVSNAKCSLCGFCVKHSTTSH